eukprot:30866-Pelagococcus_subviridis.AAC.2
MSRPTPETMPDVSVWSRPNGLPIAKTLWPTRRIFSGFRAAAVAPASLDELQHREVFVRLVSHERRVEGLAVARRDLRAIPYKRTSGWS